MSFWDIVLAVCVMAVLALAVRQLMRKNGTCNCGCCSLAEDCTRRDHCAGAEDGQA